MGSRGIVRNPRFCWVPAPYCPLQAERLTKLPLPCSWSCDNKFSTGKVNVTVCACTTKSLLSASRRRRRSNTEPMETPPQGYRRNVGICLVNSDMKIFSAVRINLPDAWQLPQGGACEGEDLRNAAIRELREETGVTSAEFLAEAPFWLTYDFPLHVKERLNRRWGTDYKGQAQKWFLFKFTGKDEEINLLGDGSEEPEFNDWSWMLPEEVVELAVYCKRPVYERVIKLFSPYFQVDGGERNGTPGHLLTTPVESKTEILTGNLGRLGVDI